ncbi:hypothetical protein NKJ71_19670 [Mesorhizobium sp. M0050]|uniref:hypothetical protein n=1 Tax=Mesorhizobium sp. M0050 TaxID=2956861 RepID=UPI00333A1891
MKTDDDTFESIGTVAERVVRNTQVSAAVPRWAWHTAALANPKQIGKTLLVHSTPEEGWFRVKSKEGPLDPVVIWQDGDQWFALRGIEPDRRQVRDVEELWTYCCRHPISFETYEAVAENGAPWPDVDATVHSQRRGPPKPGDNAGDRSESEMLADDIKAALDQLRQYKAIADDEQAGKAQSLRARLNELSGKADKIREKLVRPHLDAQKEINGEWQPLVKDAKGGADALRKTLEGYETKKLQARRAAEEAARKAEEDAANREAEMSFVAGEPEPEVTAPAAAPTTAAAPDQIRGAYGKAASVKAVTEVVEITDIDALFGFLKTHRELVDKMFDLAKRAHGAGHSVPGVRIEERASVR